MVMIPAETIIAQHDEFNARLEASRQARKYWEEEFSKAERNLSRQRNMSAILWLVTGLVIGLIPWLVEVMK